MWKHVIASSLQSAFIGALFLILVSLPSYGGAATVFGLFAFPVALIIGLVVTYPLIRLWQTYAWSNTLSFVFYASVGFILGILTPAIIYSALGANLNTELVFYISICGVIGLVCSISGWNYVRKNVTL